MAVFYAAIRVLRQLLL